MMCWTGFGSLMDIDKLIQHEKRCQCNCSFGSLMDIDKLIPVKVRSPATQVLVL